MGRAALVTGATQGLGLALVQVLAERLGKDDTVYLTGRDRQRIADAAATLTPGLAQVKTQLLDVAKESSVKIAAALLKDRHKGFDFVFSNAVARIVPSDEPAKVIENYVETNNLGTSRMLRSFAPLLKDKGRFVVVASSLGTLHYLAPVLHKNFDGLPTLEAVDQAVLNWRDGTKDGSNKSGAWPAFINIPSKIAQVAAVRAFAATRRTDDLKRGVMLFAVCPGMIDTPTSKPWFDTSKAQTPKQAATALVDLVLGKNLNESLYGELVRDGQRLPWKPER